MNRILKTGIALLLLGQLIGCVSEPTASDPINSANYLLNTLEARTPASIDATQNAFDKVMKRRDFVRTSLESSEEGKVMVYRGADDIGVTVKLKGFSQFTNIKIRYQLIGDEFISRQILDEVISVLN